MTDGLTQQQIDERVSVILGLRHLGSVLDWNPINRAFNACLNYMNAEPPLEHFVFENRRVVDAQEADLPVSAYDGEGNHLYAKMELDKAITHLRTIFGVKE